MRERARIPVYLLLQKMALAHSICRTDGIGNVSPQTPLTLPARSDRQ
jgi:hypothetical protein